MVSVSSHHTVLPQPGPAVTPHRTAGASSSASPRPDSSSSPAARSTGSARGSRSVEGSFYGASHLSEIERGTRRMPTELAEHVDKVLGTDGFFRRRGEDVRRAKRRGHASYFERVLEAEKHAETIEE